MVGLARGSTTPDDTFAKRTQSYASPLSRNEPKRRHHDEPSLAKTKPSPARSPVPTDPANRFLLNKIEATIPFEHNFQPIRNRSFTDSASKPWRARHQPDRQLRLEPSASLLAKLPLRRLIRGRDILPLPATDQSRGTRGVVGSLSLAIFGDRANRADGLQAPGGVAAVGSDVLVDESFEEVTPRFR
jgi:hypothetical protein